jgi:hypothetical protein
MHKFDGAAVATIALQNYCTIKLSCDGGIEAAPSSCAFKPLMRLWKRSRHTRCRAVSHAHPHEQCYQQYAIPLVFLSPPASCQQRNHLPERVIRPRQRDDRRRVGHLPHGVLPVLEVIRPGRGLFGDDAQAVQVERRLAVGGGRQHRALTGRVYHIPRDDACAALPDRYRETLIHAVELHPHKSHIPLSRCKTGQHKWLAPATLLPAFPNSGETHT